MAKAKGESFVRQPGRAKERLDSSGRELVSNVPMAPPIGFKRQPSLAERIRQMVKSEQLRLEAENAGYETFDEADDFDVEDDFDPQTQYEEVFEPAAQPDYNNPQLQAIQDLLDSRLPPAAETQIPDGQLAGAPDGSTEQPSGGEGGEPPPPPPRRLFRKP